ncbi:Aste57867_5821 [Aphanomyces stellatus]|uniref:Aste57867_5821 protein n=1 Tax=Aphanomyces stellatus TaxID=120398 RepID=A0A485KF30_9STRA|nr:hypothetical protein As57867_005807 [Aphanomyces stellatus]VFT82844.1 Aste57867_5821 [Aphanomyces stellatus]
MDVFVRRRWILEDVSAAPQVKTDCRLHEKTLIRSMSKEMDESEDDDDDDDNQVDMKECWLSKALAVVGIVGVVVFVGVIVLNLHPIVPRWRYPEYAFAWRDPIDVANAHTTLTRHIQTAVPDAWIHAKAAMALIIRLAHQDPAVQDAAIYDQADGLRFLFEALPSTTSLEWLDFAKQCHVRLLAESGLYMQAALSLRQRDRGELLPTISSNNMLRFLNDSSERMTTTHDFTPAVSDCHVIDPLDMWKQLVALHMPAFVMHCANNQGYLWHRRANACELRQPHDKVRRVILDFHTASNEAGPTFVLFAFSSVQSHATMHTSLHDLVHLVQAQLTALQHVTQTLPDNVFLLNHILKRYCPLANASAMLAYMRMSAMERCRDTLRGVLLGEWSTLSTPDAPTQLTYVLPTAEMASLCATCWAELAASGSWNPDTG